MRLRIGRRAMRAPGLLPLWSGDGAPRKQGRPVTIREALPIVGRRVIEVTCEDWDDLCREQPNVEQRVTPVYVHFDDGSTLTFVTNQRSGFWYDGDEGKQ